MPEHITNSVIPEGLRKRWSDFAKEVKKCWSEAHKLGITGEEAVKRYLECWQRAALSGAHLITIEEAKKYKVKPHPIAVLSLMAKYGMSKEEAEKKAIEEGKFHPISVIRALIEKEKLSGEASKDLLKEAEETLV